MLLERLETLIGEMNAERAERRKVYHTQLRTMIAEQTAQAVALGHKITSWDFTGTGVVTTCDKCTADITLMLGWDKPPHSPGGLATEWPCISPLNKYLANGDSNGG